VTFAVRHAIEFAGAARSSRHVAYRQRATIDHPELEDPFACDLSLLWRGELASLPDGSVVSR